MSKDAKSDDKSLSERIETIVDESKEAFKQAYESSGVESIGENVKDAVDRALSRRDNVVMVRLNTQCIHRVDELVEAGVVSSRSEAVAFLVSEGIGAQEELFRADRAEGRADTARQAGAPRPPQREAGRIQERGRQERVARPADTLTPALSRERERGLGSGSAGMLSVHEHLARCGTACCRPKWIWRRSCGPLHGRRRGRPLRAGESFPTRCRPRRPPL